MYVHLYLGLENYKSKDRRKERKKKQNTLHQRDDMGVRKNKHVKKKKKNILIQP